MRRWTRLEVLEVARRVLEDEKKALTRKEIWDKAKSRGYDKNVGKTGEKPWISIGKEINDDIHYNRDTPFVKVGSKPRKFSLFAFEKVHAHYCRKLVEFGKSLGYDTKIPRNSLYKLAYPDAVWYVGTRVGAPGFSKVPLVAFEVLCSESEKSIRGSLSSLMLYGSSRSVLVLLTKRNPHLIKPGTLGERRRFIRNLIESFGLKRRVFLWDETDVDRLFHRHNPQTRS